MKNNILCIFILIFISKSLAWGPLGHYVIGDIAEKNLKKKTIKKIEKILNNESIVGVGVWMDNIRSDSNYTYSYTWHWVTTINGEYNPDIQETLGDGYKAINMLIQNLKSGNLNKNDERDQLRMLIHVLADLHQPLHVGKPGDRGGNDVKINFFNKSTNLHAIWDSDLIESKKMSYTEISKELCKRLNKKIIKQYQQFEIKDFLIEAVSYREAIYNIPENKIVGYEYIYNNSYIIEERLIAAGLRLAKILEEIYN